MVNQQNTNGYDLGEPIGELVNVNGRNVHVQRMGAGQPTIWLENGWAGVALGWQSFIKMLAEHTRVCTYDRAGSGWSAPSDIYRTAQNEADEFAALLDVLEEDAPFVILAWSGGGPVAQVFAADHPDKVAGLILMDAIPPNYNLWATQTFPNRYAQEKQFVLEEVRRRAEKSAAGELTYDEIADWLIASTLDDYGDYYTNLILKNPHYWWTYYWQNQFAITSGAQVQAKTSLTDMPMTVVIAKQPRNWSEEAQEDRIYRESLARMWQTMQVEQARLSTRGEVVWVDASHAVFRDQPQVMVDVALDLIKKIKN